MTQMNYEEIADRTIRNFIKAVVLIDDHWSEAQSAPIINEIDSTQLDLEPQTFLPQESSDETTTTNVQVNSSESTIQTDPAYLREIGTEITQQGFLFTGFAYTDALRETATNLAKKSDILILDWYLGSADPRPALDLLEDLKKSGCPRFIFILTDQELDEVRRQIIEQLGEPTGETDLIFSCGPFSFSLKNKHQVGGPDSILASKVLEEAISGIRERFGGLLQLAALELLGQYRDSLHEVLNHFQTETDLPFILEWFENDSPIQDSNSFNALAIDEWTARVTRRFPPSDASVIRNETVSALIKKWKETKTLPPDHKDFLKDAFEKSIEFFNKENKTPFPTDDEKVKALLTNLEEWIVSGDCNWPTSLKGQNRGMEWSKEAKRILALQYLALRSGVESPIEKLAALDVLFQCQAYLPSNLTQGTVLIDPVGTYLICITPTCDCSRPTSRIKNCYIFLQAYQVDISTLKNHPEDTIIAVRTKDKGNILLSVSLKPTYTYKIDNPSLERDLNASVTYGANETFVIKPVAQLRPARVQSLVSLAAGKAIEVGLDRSELLRQICKQN